MIFPCVKHANTKIQIQNTQMHKYSIRRSARKTQHVVYFWKADCSRISKIIFLCVKHAYTKIQIHKYTNTAYDKVPERPSMWYNTVAVLSLCQLSIVECSKSSKDFCTEIHSGLFSPISDHSPWGFFDSIKIYIIYITEPTQEGFH